MEPMSLLLAHNEPAGGAPTADLIPAAVVGVLLVGFLAAFGAAHRGGRTRLLARVGAFSERVSGLPRWAAVPLGTTAVSLIVAVFGFYWDVATHIDNGRDPGPFANPAHFLIIFGLGGIALAGVISILFGTEPSATSVRIREGWHAPVGGVLLLVCGGIAVLGFPLDDVWHRLFGQDVTLWSPTHLQMVGGAALSTLALLVLQTEGRRAAVDATRAEKLDRIALPAGLGALLIGFSAFQAEFDFSVPQFRLLYHPVLLMLSSGAALVAARIRLGRGGAIKAVAFYVVVRSLVSLLVGPILDHTTLHFPLYLVEALVVEVIAARLGSGREVALGIYAGAAIGTFGLAAEWAWSHLWMTMAWPTALLPEALVLGFAAAIAGGCLGVMIGRSIRVERARGRDLPRIAAVGAALAALATLAYPFPVDANLEGRARVALDSVERSEGRWVKPRISFAPDGVVDDVEWLNVTSWQGGGSYVEDLVEIEDGVYSTTSAIPVYGEWKSLLRIHAGSSMVAVPIFLPRDEAIPAPEVPARDGFSREFTSDKKIVLREAKDVDAGLTVTASTFLAILVAVWILALAWGLRRIGSSGGSVGRWALAGAPGK